MSHQVAEDLNHFTVSDLIFYRKGKFSLEFHYPFDFNEFLVASASSPADVVTFVDFASGMCVPDSVSPRIRAEQDDAAVLEISTYEDWWNNAEKRTRNMVRRASKCGVQVRLVDVDEQLIEGAYQIYNETRIRQGRLYVGYGTRKEHLRERFFGLRDPQLIGAFHQGRMVALMHLICGNSVAAVRTNLISVGSRNTLPNNAGIGYALVAAAIERCSKLGIRRIVYGKLGWQPGLDFFKRSIGFEKKIVPRYYLPFTRRGTEAMRLGLHREAWMLLPRVLGTNVFPIVDSLATIKEWSAHGRE